MVCYFVFHITCTQNAVLIWTQHGSENGEPRKCVGLVFTMRTTKSVAHVGERETTQWEYRPENKEKGGVVSSSQLAKISGNPRKSIDSQ
jgi:hypothetical protein